MAQAKGVEEARNFALKIEGDSRVPMKQIYEAYRGKATTAEVMLAAEHGYPNAAELNDRLFYAHLYVGLFEDVAGNTEAARRHYDARGRQLPGGPLHVGCGPHPRALVGSGIGGSVDGEPLPRLSARGP